MFKLLTFRQGLNKLNKSYTKLTHITKCDTLYSDTHAYPGDNYDILEDIVLPMISTSFCPQR